MTCGSKKFNCGNSALYAACVKYQGDLPSWSVLDECASVEDAVEEQYEKLTALLAAIDVSDFESECESFSIDETPTLREYLLNVKAAIEDLKCVTSEDSSTDITITGYDLDFKCLKDNCDVAITKLSQLLQVLINKACETDEPEVLINSGAISLYSKVTHLKTTSTSATTLADGLFDGQEKFILMTQFGGNNVIGVPSLRGGTNLTFNQEGDFIKLIFSGEKWNILSNNNVTVS